MAGNSGLLVTGITENSSRVKKGFVFVARKGKQSDGAMYIKKAIEQGAAAIVIDRTNLTEIPANVVVITVSDCTMFMSHASARLAGNPAKRMKVIAVTGTNGKTTVTHFIGQLLRKFWKSGGCYWYDRHFYRWR